MHCLRDGGAEVFVELARQAVVKGACGMEFETPEF